VDFAGLAAKCVERVMEGVIEALIKGGCFKE
jgi:hypothetical protein